MNLNKVIYPLISLCWFFGNSLNVLAQPVNSSIDQQSKPIQIAVIPFCDESGETNDILKPDPKILYKYILGEVQGLYACQKPVEWITHKQNGDEISTYASDQSEADGISCQYLITDTICHEVEADLLVRGEFIANSNGEVEVYYSYENCDGLHATGIEYLTPQPLRLNTTEIDQMYKGVAEAIGKDLQHFLDCKQGISLLEIEPQIQSAIDLYKKADQNALNYLKAIEALQEVLNVQSEHPKALYYTGLAYFSLSEYDNASPYFASTGEKYLAPMYQEYCRLKSKPAQWYDSEKKRQEWWEGLSDQWKTILTNKGWEKAPLEMPSDSLLQALFTKESLDFEGIVLPDLSGVEALTQLRQLNCNKTALKSLKGIQNLTNLEELSVNKNELTSVKEIGQLLSIKQVYCQKNPLESLEGVEHKTSLEIFCKGSVSKKEMKRVADLGVKVNP